MYLLNKLHYLLNNNYYLINIPMDMQMQLIHYKHNLNLLTVQCM